MNSGRKNGNERLIIGLVNSDDGDEEVKQDADEAELAKAEAFKEKGNEFFKSKCHFTL